MKEKKINIIIIVLLIIISIISFITIKKNRVTNDEKKFKKEYERFNGRTGLSTNKKYLNITIPNKNGVIYINDKELIKLLSKGTGIIYFGFPECPWCRNMIVPLLETTKTKNEPVYYYNAYPIRDYKELNEEGKIITKEQGSKTYYKILELLGSHADKYKELNNEKEKRLYFPTVVFVKDGKIVGKHTSTVKSQKNPYNKLSRKQIKELKNIYEKNIVKMQTKINPNVCTKKGSCQT